MTAEDLIVCFLCQDILVSTV